MRCRLFVIASALVASACTVTAEQQSSLALCGPDDCTPPPKEEPPPPPPADPCGSDDGYGECLIAYCTEDGSDSCLAFCEQLAESVPTEIEVCYGSLLDECLALYPDPESDEFAVCFLPRSGAALQIRGALRLINGWVRGLQGGVNVIINQRNAARLLRRIRTARHSLDDPRVFNNLAARQRLMQQIEGLMAQLPENIAHVWRDREVARMALAAARAAGAAAAPIRQLEQNILQLSDEIERLRVLLPR